MAQKLFIGLGNPGKRYGLTRHNLGIRVLRCWLCAMADKAVSVRPWEEDAAICAEVAWVSLMPDETVVCLFPLTSMNRSGQAVVSYCKSHPIKVEDILIIHDELELPLGAVRVKEGGSARGHNGVKSIHKALGTRDIPRLLLGIGRPGQEVPVENYVLQNFFPQEEKVVGQVIDEACKKLTEFTVI